MIELTHKYKFLNEEEICECRSGKTKKQNLNKRKKRKRNTPRLLAYPPLEEVTLKTFQIKYNKKLSSVAKLILNSFQNKYIYYAMDDILYSFRSNPMERDNLLAILYSPVLSLQNNLSTNFFDIWIHEIHIHEVSKVNRFLKHDFKNVKQLNYITIKLFYKTRVPSKKRDSLW